MKNKLIPVLLIVCTLPLIFSCSEKKEVTEVALGKVTKGTLFLEIYEEGEVEAINSTNCTKHFVAFRQPENHLHCKRWKRGAGRRHADCFRSFGSA